MDFFKPEEIQFFQQRLATNNVYRKGDTQDVEDGVRIKREIFTKANEWAQLVATDLPEDYELIKDNRWNTSGYFKPYAFPRLYPSAVGDKGIYFMLVVTGDTGKLGLEIDCQRSGNALSKSQVDLFDQILKQAGWKKEEIYPEELADMDWEDLKDRGISFITKYRPLFDELVEKVTGFSEGLQEATLPMEHPLNQILYGPPGTGKTYHTIDLAAKILGFDKGDHKKNLEAFNERLGKSIEFVTFHQSFLYEDFIEGIKPVTVTTKEGTKTVTYEVVDGVFKRIAKRAELGSLQKDKASAKSEFERVFESLKNEMAASDDDEVEIPMKRVSYHITGITSNAIAFRKASGGTAHNLNIDTLRKIYTKALNYSRDGLGVYYYPLVDYLKSKAAGAPKLEEIAGSEAYVLIIDEINRGNISAIFGELITLLEEDKRAEGDHPLTLTYSKAEFSVPSNLYLIGTMNTADRSVEALDTALRRRFSFVEVPPDPELLSSRRLIQRLWQAYTDVQWDNKEFRMVADRLYRFLGISAKQIETKGITKGQFALGHQYSLEDIPEVSPDTSEGVDLKEMLTTINERIELLLDKDHCIGHAYFMGIATADNPWAELKRVFGQKVLPLLQEYFYGDLGKIQLILGKAFCERVGGQSVNFAKERDYEADGLDERDIYRIVDVAAMEQEDFAEAVKQITA